MKQITQWIHPKYLPVKKCVLTSTLFLLYSAAVMADSQLGDKEFYNLTDIAQPKIVDWDLMVDPEFCSCTNPNTALLQLEEKSILSPPSDDITETTCKNDSFLEGETILAGNELTKDNNNFPWTLFYPLLVPKSNQCSGWNLDSDSKQWFYYFDDIIRIGDDIDINETHLGEEFCISSAYSPTYTADFTIPEGCEYTEAKLQYWVTGVSQDNEILINGKLVDTTCNTDNSSTRCCTNGPITITDKLHVGINTLHIKTILFPGDDTTPYDDIEIYRLHIYLEN